MKPQLTQGLALGLSFSCAIIIALSNATAGVQPSPPPANTVPLQKVLKGLNAKEPGLVLTYFSENGAYGPNSVSADYTNAVGVRITIITKAYDSEAAAKSGQELDERTVSVGWEKTEVIQGVKVYEYTTYGGLFFQTGPYTFRLNTIRRQDEDVWPMLRAISSALIDGLAPPGKPSSAVPK